MTRLTDTAIVLNRAPSGETSLVVGLLCRGGGRVAAIAKGACAPGSGLAGALDLLQEIDVVLHPSRRGGRAWVHDAVVLNPFRGLRGDFRRFELACYFSSLTALCLDEGHPAPDVYDLLRLALSHVDSHPPTLRIMQRFEWRLLELLGLQPAGEPHSRARFSDIFGQNFHALPPGRPRLLAFFAAAGKEREGP